MGASTRKPAAFQPAQAELPLALAPAPARRVVPLAVLARHPRAGRPWTPAEKDNLRLDLPRLGLKRTARDLRRPMEEVRSMADSLGVVETAEDRRRRQELEAAGVVVPPSTQRTRRGRATTWSAAEDAAILTRYATEGAQGLSLDTVFNARTVKAIEVRASRLGVKMDPEVARSHRTSAPRWTEEEDAILDEADSVDALVMLLPRLPGRSAEPTISRWYARREPARVVQPWSEEDDERLEELYPCYPPKRVAELMGRTYAAVTNRATARGLTHAYRKWTDVDDAVLRMNFADTPIVLLAKRLGRTPLACHIRAAKLGLVPDETKD